MSSWRIVSASSCSRSKWAVAPAAVASTRYLIGGLGEREPPVGRELGFGVNAKLVPVAVCGLPWPLLTLAPLTVQVTAGAVPASGAAAAGGSAASSVIVSVEMNEAPLPPWRVTVGGAAGGAGWRAGRAAAAGRGGGRVSGGGAA